MKGPGAVLPAERGEHRKSPGVNLTSPSNPAQISRATRTRVNHLLKYINFTKI